MSNHPTEELSSATFRDLVSSYAGESMNETSQSLETLLFYGRQSRQFLETERELQLDAPRFEFLQRELERTHASISIRVTDENGQIRASLPPTRVPLDRRHEFTLDVFDVQPLICSGSVKRVGLYHLWTRL